MYPTIGRIVHFTFPPKDPDDQPQTRAAMVVRDWGNGCVNLHVFLDGENDTRYDRREWQTSITASSAVDDKPPGTVPAIGYWNWGP